MRAGVFDYAVINTKKCFSRVLRKYREQGAEPVDPCLRNRIDGLRYVTGDLLQEENVVRHDEGRLTRLLINENLLRSNRISL